MLKFLLKISITAFAFILFALPVFAAAISASGPIVTCGRTGQPFCNLCDIPILIKNLIDYMTFYVAFPLAALMFVVGGYFYLIAGGSSQKISQAKEVFFTTIKGLGIVLLSWLFIAELMVVLTGGTTTTAGFKGLSQPWNQLQPSASCPFGTPVLVLPPPPPPSSSRCDNTFGAPSCMPGGIWDGGPGITCSSDADCGSPPIGKQCEIDETTGEPTGVCSVSGTGGTCTGPADCGSPPIGKQCEIDETTGEPTGVCSVSGTGGTCTGPADCGSPPIGKQCEIDETTGEPTGVCSVSGTGGTCTGPADCGSPPIGKKCVLDAFGVPAGICSTSGTGSDCTSDSDPQCAPPLCSLTIFDCGSAPSGYHWTINTAPEVCACWLVADSWLICWDLALCGGEWRCKPNGNADGCFAVGTCCEPGSLP